MGTFETAHLYDKAWAVANGDDDADPHLTYVAMADLPGWLVL